GKLLLAPLVGLVEVDLCAEESPGVQCVEVASDGIGIGCRRRERSGEEIAQLVVGDTSGRGAVGELTSEGCRQSALVGCGLGDERREESVVSGVPRDLAGYFDDLSTGGD